MTSGGSGDGFISSGKREDGFDLGVIALILGAIALICGAVGDDLPPTLFVFGHVLPPPASRLSFYANVGAKTSSLLISVISPATGAVSKPVPRLVNPNEGVNKL